MATELGQAYVQIMPSAKGISGSIQKIINPEAKAAGKSAGSSIASSMADSMGSAGKKLTRSITLPAAGAATAIGGIVGALGFKRLVSVDTAQGQLKGLGYSAKDVERISGQLAKALEGGMLTMGEATSAAANGMAAGVSEGKELTKYIQLLDSAVVGGTGSFDEMNQIFAQTADLGHLTSNNFDMMAMRMPGFSSAMQKHTGKSGQAFRDMLNSGEVTFDDFLDLMDDFAGDMAGAYSETWAGMAQNTLAYVGMIGEAILEGLFEDGKKGLANFIEVLKSEELQSWATETGEKIRSFVQSAVEALKGLKSMWDDLSPAVQGFITKVSAIGSVFLILLGPALSLTSFLVRGFTSVSLVVAKIAPLFKAIGTAIAFLTTPVGLTIAAIVAAAALIYIYWEPISEFFLNLWDSIKDAGLLIWENLQEGWENAVENLQEAWTSTLEFFSELWESTKEIFMEFIEWLGEAWASSVEFTQEKWSDLTEFFSELMISIKELFYEVYEWLNEKTNGVFGEYVEIIRSFLQMAQEIISSILSYIKDTFTNYLDFIKALVTLDFQGMKDAMKNQMDTAKNLLSNIWNSIKSFVSSVLSSLVNIASASWSNITSTISNFMSSIFSTISSIWSSIVSTISSFLGNISSSVSSIFGSLGGIVSGAMGAVLSAISTGMSGALNTVTGIASSFFNAGKNIASSIADGIKAAIGKVTGAMSDMVGKVRDMLPFSNAKIGPLDDIMDVKWGDTISGGIEKGEGAVAKAMENMLDFDLTKKAQFHNPTNNKNTLEDKEESQGSQPIYLQVDGKTFARIMGDYTSEEGGKRIRRVERGLA